MEPGMSEQDNGNHSHIDNDEAPASVLVIQFAAPGSAEFAFQANGVSPMQMLAAAAYLEEYARNVLRQQMLAKQVNKSIAIPTGFDARKLRG
jgi:hypothetical protein